MKILFNALGPKDTVSFGDKIYKNGSTVEMPKEYAIAYINVGLAIEIKNDDDEKEVQAVQKLEVKNAVRRKEIQEKSKQMKEGE